MGERSTHTLVRFKYSAYITAGVEIQKNKFRILLLDLNCSVVDRVTVTRAFEASKSYWEDVYAAIEDIRKKNDISSERFMGVGVSVPGPVNQEEKTFSSILLDIDSYSYQEIENIMK